MREASFLWIVVLTIGFASLAGCSGDDGGPPPQGVDYYPIESDPSLSLDRQYVYLALLDTLVPSLNGIYRAKADRPEREMVWKANDLSSPSISADYGRLAVLRNDSLIWVTFADSSVTKPDLARSFEAVSFLGNNLLVTFADSTICRVTVPGGNLTFDRYGYDPTAVTESSYVYIGHKDLFNWVFVEAFLNGTADTLFTQNSTARPYWPQVTSNRDKVVWANVTDSGYSFVVHSLSSGPFINLASSAYARGCVITNHLLFTGQRTILNQVSLFGGSISLWIYAQPIESSPVAP